MNQPSHLTVEAPRGRYVLASEVIISTVSPYLVDLVTFIKAEYFAMSDNFDIEEILIRFTDTMGEREKLIAETLSDVNLDDLMFIRPDDPNYSKVAEILGSTNSVDIIAYPKSVDLEKWIAANGSPAEDE